MKVNIVDSDSENFEDIPEPCRYCLYWEFPRDCEKNLKKNIAEEMKKKWFEATLKSFRGCGKIIYVDGKATGYTQYAPSSYLPNANNYDLKPDKTAVFISCLYIPSENMRKKGLGTNLLKSIIKASKKQGIKALETFTRKGNSNNPSGPVEFYLKNGFRIAKDHQEFPLVRLELNKGDVN